MPEHETTLHHSGSEADACRQRGWGPGTRLVGDEGYGPAVIQITYVGDSMILAKCLSRAGRPIAVPRENAWVLFCRDWKEVTDGGL